MIWQLSVAKNNEVDFMHTVPSKKASAHCRSQPSKTEYSHYIEQNDLHFDFPSSFRFPSSTNYNEAVSDSRANWQLVIHFPMTKGKIIHKI